MKRKLLGYIFIVLSFFGHLYAQNYPVQVIPQLIPPSPIYISNYADATTINSPLRVQILLNDITISNREIRLKVYVEGSGVYLQSTNVVLGASPLYLEGGVPLTLTNIELAPYFEYRNMPGSNPNLYSQPLPEGSYQFCFEVFDVATGNRLSAKTCAANFIFHNDPPFLNMPFKNEEIAVKNPQNIVFQWTPRNINVSNIEYELSIVEIWDNYIDPQAAFFSMPPIFEVTTRATSYVLGPADPMLLPNKKYAWRVKAKALLGAEEIGVFKNQGYSEVYWFNHTQSCAAPSGVYAELKGASKVNVYWGAGVNEFKNYTIAYREVGNNESNWYTKITNSDWATLWDLKPGTTYEIKVRGACELSEGTYSEPVTITTGLIDDTDSFYSCGLVPDEIVISNRNPLPILIPGNEITAGDFAIKIIEVVGSNGRFSGKGRVKIPYLNLAVIGVTFNNILVNADYQLAEGEIVTLYDSNFGVGDEMTVDVNIDKIVESIEDILEDVFGESDESNDGENENNEVEENDESSNESNNNEEQSNNEDSSQGEDSNTPDTTSGTETANPTGEGSQSEGTNQTDNESEEELITIQHEGVNYSHGDVIEIVYKNNLENQRFDLINVDEDANISWSLHADMTQLQATASAGEGVYAIFDVKEYQNNALEAYWKPKNADSNSEFEKIRVKIKLIKEEFDFVELYAKPALSKRRLAKSGEILYLIDDSGLSESSKHKKVDYGIKINPKIDKDKIDPLDIKWYYGVNDADYAKDKGSTNISRNLRISDELINTKVKAGYKETLEKDIDVKWVDQYEVSTDYLTKFSKVLTFLEQFNRISTDFKKVLPCEASILRNFSALAGANKIKFKLKAYNEEDKETREIFDVLETDLKLQSSNLAQLKCGKDIGFLGVSIGKIYGSMGLGADLDFIYSLKTRNETSTQKAVPKITGGIILTTDFGFETSDIIDEWFFVKATFQIKAGTKTIYPYQNKNYLVGSYFYTGKTYIVVEGYVDTWLTGREDFNFKYMIIDTSWESDRILVFDLKDSDIYFTD